MLAVREWPKAVPVTNLVPQLRNCVFWSTQPVHLVSNEWSNWLWQCTRAYPPMLPGRTETTCKLQVLMASWPHSWDLSEFPAVARIFPSLPFMSPQHWTGYRSSVEPCGPLWHLDWMQVTLWCHLGFRQDLRTFLESSLFRINLECSVYIRSVCVCLSVCCYSSLRGYFSTVSVPPDKTSLICLSEGSKIGCSCPHLGRNSFQPPGPWFCHPFWESRVFPVTVSSFGECRGEACELFPRLSGTPAGYILLSVFVHIFN